MAHRVAERFGLCPFDWFNKLGVEQQRDLLVYERVRQTEESENKRAELQALFGKGKG